MDQQKQYNIKYNAIRYLFPQWLNYAQLGTSG